jgi:uncharacterized RDD family membrane protein YckC
LAFFIDMTVLAIVGAIIGLFMHNELIALGGGAVLIGFVIALGYFGVANSRALGGRTIGKRALGLRVVDAHGAELGVPRSLRRAGILCAPIFLNGARLGSWAMLPWVTSLASLIVIGGTFALLYLLVFNRPTHRSLHDLATDSVVVIGNPPFPIPRSTVRTRHGVVVGVVAVGSLALPWGLSQSIDAGPLRSMLALSDSVASESAARATNVSVGSMKQASAGAGSSTRTYLRVQVQLVSQDRDLDNIANEIVAALLSTFPTLGSKDVISVEFTYGYDLGIWRQWTTRSRSFSPAEWDDRIQPALEQRARHGA